MTTYASPFALATMSAPSRPPAPGLFSTTIGWPSLLPKYSARVRDRMSAAPAGGKLTIQRIGLEGHAACAFAIAGAAEAAIRKFRRDSMIQCEATYVPPS